MINEQTLMLPLSLSDLILKLGNLLLIPLVLLISLLELPPQQFHLFDQLPLSPLVFL